MGCLAEATYMQLSAADYAVFFTYMVGILIVGLYVAKREKATSTDYFLAGNTLPWYAIGFSLVATSISTEQFIGEVGFAYRYGVAVANWEWGVLPALTIFLVFFVPFYLRNKIRTMPEYLERRFGAPSRVVFSAISVAICTFVNLAGVLYSGGLALKTMFGWDIWWSIVMLAVVTGIYTVAGGLASVVWTDVFQCILLLAGGLLVFFLGLNAIGGWETLRGTGERAHLILPANHPVLPWTGIVILMLSTNLWYYATNQYINQRVLGARNEWHARAGVLFAAFLGIFLTLSVCFPGLVAYHLFPNLENPDEAYPRVVNKLVGQLGFGLRGLVFAGLIGAIMSTIDSLINSIATLVTLDFYKRFFRKDASEKRMVQFGQISSTLAVVIAVCWTPVVKSWGSVFSYFQECYVFMAMPVVVVFVAGLLWKRSSSPAAFWTLMLCFPMTSMPYLLRLKGDVIRDFLGRWNWELNPNSFLMAGVALVPVAVLHIILSLLSPKQAVTDVGKCLWDRSMLFLPTSETAGGYPWYKRILLWWIILLILFAGLYAIFW
jgi:SSS family solute:Na+ symporter